MLKATLDNTVYVSDAALSGPGARKLMEAWRAGSFQIVVSEPVLFETANVLAAEGVAAKDIADYISGLRESALSVTSTERITACRDPDDNKVLEAAFSGEADYIVTDDKDLRVLSPFRGIQIVTVNRFLRRLGISRKRRKN